MAVGSYIPGLTERQLMRFKKEMKKGKQRNARIEA